MVISGFAGAEFAARGRVKAYDATDGSLLWTFYTVPAPGEFGSDTWPADSDAWETGGGTVWHTPAVDPELGLIYFSTGNPGPDYNGAIRAGDNLFTASIVALDAYSGEYRWHFQQVHHDIWDFDAPNPVVLFDLDYEGVLRKGLAQAGKTGWVYILDRVTGEPLVGIEERPVPQEERQATAATQPYPVGDAFVTHTLDIAPEGFRMVNDGDIFTPFWDDPVLLRRGKRIGHRVPLIRTKGLFMSAQVTARRLTRPTRTRIQLSPAIAIPAVTCALLPLRSPGLSRPWTCGPINAFGRSDGRVVATVVWWQQRGICYSRAAMTGGLPPWMLRPVKNFGSS